MSTRLSNRHAALAVLLFFLLRLILVGLLGPVKPPRYADTAVYYDASKGLPTCIENWVRPGAEFGRRPPLYFIYLAAVFTFLPQSGYRTAQLATSLLGVLTCLLVFLITNRTEGENASEVALWARGLSMCFLLPDTFVMSEPLFAALEMAAILVFLSAPPAPNWKHAIGLGILVGLCMLTRESATGFPLIFGGGLILLGGPARKRAVSVCLFTLALMLCLLPWMWRNQIVWGRPLPLSLTSGANLHIGNNPATIGRWQEIPESAPGYIRPGTPEANKWHTEQAIRYIIDRPGQFFINGFKKVAWFVFPSFNRDPVVHIYSGPPVLLTLISVLAGLTSAFFILAGFAGFVLGKPSRFWWLSASLLFYYSGLTFIAFGHPRLRDPLDQILVCYAASFVTNLQNVRLQLKSGLPTMRRKVWILSVGCAFILFNWIVLALRFKLGTR